MYIENGLLDNLAELHLDDFDPMETGSSDGQSIDRVHRGEEKKKKMDADSTQKRFQRRDEGTYVIIGGGIAFIADTAWCIAYLISLSDQNAA